jgi:nucleoside triphosphate pyrophosphatase
VASPFILASNSSRRRALLAKAGYEFEVIVPDVSETASTHLSLRELTIANATRKGLVVSRLHPRRIVLAADTLVALEGEVIGKPRDLTHARAILRRLSGRTHDVCTGVCIVDPQKKLSFAEISQVCFHKLSENDIANYLRVVNPIDKAGAYAAQVAGRTIIASVEGSFTNVIGLPMERTIPFLAQFGLRPVNASRPRLPASRQAQAPARVSIPGTKTKR